MAGNRIICECNGVDYITIRKSMIRGVRTMEELEKDLGIESLACCEDKIMPILTSVCGCKEVSLQAVVDAVKGGADSVEKVGEITGAGTVCERCIPLVENVIALGR